MGEVPPALKMIPQNPSQPEGLIQKQPTFYSHCERFFLFQGKKIECDSNLGWDAESLRPIVQSVPQALAELDRYQANRKEVLISGYLATSAVVLIGLGLSFSGGQPLDPSTGAVTLGGGVVLAGLTLGMGAIIHGIGSVTLNEGHIEKAVHYYNEVHPTERIELQFKTDLASELLP
jgi:hypothetical protein